MLSGHGVALPAQPFLAALLRHLFPQRPIVVVTEGLKPWLVHFEVDTKDDGGKAVHLVFEGKLENIGAFNKHLTGTLTANGQKGEFKSIMQ